MPQGAKNRQPSTPVRKTLKNEVEIVLAAIRATEVKEKAEAETKWTIAPKLRLILL